jgi:hypothetical protein
MRSNEINKFLPGLHSQVRTIEGKLADSPISPKKFELLTKQLDGASKKLQVLEKTSDVFAKAQTGYLQEKVVSLSKELIDRLVQGQISQIQEESFALRKKISQGTVKKLETHIKTLERNHKTSIPHRRIIADAKNALLEAKARLEGKPVMKHFEWLASQKNIRLLESIELLPGEVEELFDIAKAIYDRDFRQAKRRFSTLPEDHKRRFQRHMQNLTAKPFDDPLETMQALIATVNELVKNGESYPSRDQIDQLFLGLSQVTNEERGNKISSLHSREFLKS